MRPLGEATKHFADCEGIKMMIRKFVTILEECCMESGQLVDPPTRRAAAAAVVMNPYMDEYEEEVAPRLAFEGDLGILLTRKCTDILGIGPGQAECCGTAALVGSQGELEHASSILRSNVCKPVGEIAGDAKPAAPSTKKLGIPGSEIDVPLHRRNPSDVRAFFDSMLVRIPDAPREDEIVVVLAMSITNRP
ncbi:MAG: amino acid synthesis family protein [Deltaproteobacteria bacterium]|nr:amino acid synthesis family protein [Deltaproteobacteria bacterium]